MYARDASIVWICCSCTCECHSASTQELLKFHLALRKDGITHLGLTFSLTLATQTCCCLAIKVAHSHQDIHVQITDGIAPTHACWQHCNVSFHEGTGGTARLMQQGKLISLVTDFQMYVNIKPACAEQLSKQQRVPRWQSWLRQAAWHCLQT